MRKIFEGVGVAIVTPFMDGVIDYDSFGGLIDSCIKHGAGAIIVLGTTGESVAITDDERAELLTYAKHKINKRAKFIIGTGSNNFDKANKFTEQAKLLQADACLVVTPYYNKTTQNGIINYYAQLAKHKLPIIMYNVPSRTGLNIDTDTVKKIIETNPYVCGLKEASSDINRILILSKICKGKIALYSGEDALNYIFYTLGADGCISVTANVYTKNVKGVFDLVQTGQYSKARNIQQQMSEVDRLMFCQTNPIPVKYFLQKTDKIKSAEVRMPLVELEKCYKEEIDNLFLDEPF